jgi:hypothetical protein
LAVIVIAGAGLFVQPVTWLVDVNFFKSVLNVAFVHDAGVTALAGAAKPTATIEVAASPRTNNRIGRI